MSVVNAHFFGVWNPAGRKVKVSLLLLTTTLWVLKLLLATWLYALQVHCIIDNVCLTCSYSVACCVTSLEAITCTHWLVFLSDRCIFWCFLICIKIEIVRVNFFNWWLRQALKSKVNHCRFNYFLQYLTFILVVGKHGTRRNYLQICIPTHNMCDDQW